MKRSREQSVQPARSGRAGEQFAMGASILAVSDSIGGIQDCAVKEFRRADDLNTQQASVRIEVEHDFTPTRTLYDDVRNGGSLGDVVLDSEVSSIRFAVIRDSHEAFEHFAVSAVRRIVLPQTARAPLRSHHRIGHRHGPEPGR